MLRTVLLILFTVRNLQVELEPLPLGEQTVQLVPFRRWLAKSPWVSYICAAALALLTESYPLLL